MSKANGTDRVERKNRSNQMGQLAIQFGERFVFND
jgi:hypothetical protein